MQPAAAESHEAGGQHLTEVDFGHLLQQQLARLRRSWNHEVQQPTAAPAFHDGATKRAAPPAELPPNKQPRLVGVEVVEMEQVDLAGAPKLPGAQNSTQLNSTQLNSGAQNLTQGDAVGGSSVGAIYPEPEKEPAGGFRAERYSMTQRQHALHVARQRMQMTNSSTVQWEIILTLALALGAARMETGTYNALRAVLLQLDSQPRISDKEAYTSTGASMSNFLKWRKRVINVQRSSVLNAQRSTLDVLNARAQRSSDARSLACYL